MDFKFSLTLTLGGLRPRRELDREGEAKQCLFSSLPRERRVLCPQSLMAAPGGRKSVSALHREETEAQGLKPLAQGHVNISGELR